MYSSEIVWVKGGRGSANICHCKCESVIQKALVKGRGRVRRHERFFFFGGGGGGGRVYSESE